MNNLQNILVPKNEEHILKDLSKLSKRKINSLLIAAVYEGSLYKTLMLIKFGANTKVRTTYGITIRKWAEIHGYAVIANALYKFS